jgi:carboxymethylenebutenolidase
MQHTEPRISTEDGDCPAHEFRPDGAGPHRAVLVYMDGLGIRPAMLQLAERIAAAGYHVLLPDLFWRSGPYEPVDAHALFADPAARAAWFQKHVLTTTIGNTMRDTRFFLDHLGAAPVGVTGYCMGGRMALACAGHFGDRIAAAASWHPANLATDAADSPHTLAAQIRAEVYIGAATDDPTFPVEQHQRLDAALTAANVTHTIDVYPATHGWVPTDTPVHHPACAERHWDTLLDLFARRLR